MTRRGLPIGPPPEDLTDLALDHGLEDSPFLRPRVRTRLRPRRRGLAQRLVVTLQAAAIGLVALVGVWLGWQRIFASDRLRVTQLEVHGNHFLSEGEVRELIGPALGENVLTLDIEALKGRLRASPWVAEAIVTRRLPGTLRIEIHERVPLALAELDRPASTCRSCGGSWGSRRSRAATGPAAPASCSPTSQTWTERSRRSPSSPRAT